MKDLSKVFESIPHNLLSAKLHAYGFSEETLVSFYSYLKRRKQIVKTSSTFEILLSDVPLDSVLGPIFINIPINSKSSSAAVRSGRRPVKAHVTLVRSY